MKLHHINHKYHTYSPGLIFFIETISLVLPKPTQNLILLNCIAGSYYILYFYISFPLPFPNIIQLFVQSTVTVIVSPVLNLKPGQEE